MELSICNISMQYKDIKAVDNLSLNLTAGVWGLLGANGAGKTTLMRIICGILKPTIGRVLYGGEPIERLGEDYRRLLGYLPQSFGYYPEFSVIDYLQYIASLKGLTDRQANERIDYLLDIVSLSDVRSKKIRKLSGGMQRRVGIAQAMLNNPTLLILDEPTSGLDPAERVRFRNIISEFARDRIVLISTHIVSDVEYIASCNAIMQKGNLVCVGATDELTNRMIGRVWNVTVSSKNVDKIEKTVSPINLKNDSDGGISIRYIADEPLVEGSTAAEPRLEDLYMWIFKEDRGEKQ